MSRACASCEISVKTRLYQHLASLAKWSKCESDVQSTRLCCTAKAAIALSDRLGSLVDGLSKTLKVAKKPRLSVGISRLDEMLEPNPQMLLELADKALYRLKSERKGLLQPAAASVQSSASNPAA